jgi:hypothetical protein
LLKDTSMENLPVTTAQAFCSHPIFSDMHSMESECFTVRRVSLTRSSSLVLSPPQFSPWAVS